MKAKLKKILFSSELLTMMVILSSTVSLLADPGTHWMQYCQNYDTYIMETGCHTDSNYNCLGRCAKVTFPTGTASCGFCTSTFNPFSWCTTASSPTITTVNMWEVPCEWQQVDANPPESVTWECSCGSAWILNSTMTFYCRCS